MIKNYFIYNGNTYYTGAVLVIQYFRKEEEMAFIYYNPETLCYVCQHENRRCILNEKYFRKNLVRVTDKIDHSVKAPVIKTMKDSQIDGMDVVYLYYGCCSHF